MPRKKLERRQIALEPVAGRARHDQVARIVRPAAGERHHMIQRRRVLIEMRRAVHTPLTAITQRPFAQRVFHGDMHHRRPRRTARPTAGTCPRAHRRSARRSATTRRRTVAAATQLERWTSGHTSAPPERRRPGGGHEPRVGAKGGNDIRPQRRRPVERSTAAHMGATASGTHHPPGAPSGHANHRKPTRDVVRQEICSHTRPRCATIRSRCCSRQ